MILTKFSTKSTPFYRLLFFTALVVSATSCNKTVRVVDSKVDNPPVNKSYTNGIFVVNEGNFNWGNASVTFINNNDSAEQNVYEDRNNNTHLGDVAESMQIFNNKGYIIINNSNKIRIVSLSDFKLTTVLDGFYSPRFMTLIDSTKAYVTNMQNNISVVDLREPAVTKTISTPGWTEAIIRYNNMVFVTSIGNASQASATRNARVLVIDTKSDMITDSIKTGKEPVSMVIDKKDKIWVLCTGGYDHYEPPTLLRIDPVLKAVDKTFSFSDPSTVPSKLCINGTRDTIYFLANGVYQMPVSSSSVPQTPFIPANGRLFYGLGIHPLTGNIFVSDAKDYVQNGVVYQYNQNTASIIHTFPAGRIPGSFCFTAQGKKK